MNLDFRSDKALDGARAFAAGHNNGHQCSECQFAQLYALEDRAECVSSGNVFFGRVRLATSPACRRFAVRPVTDVVVAEFIPTHTRSEKILAHAS
jgi:hypothetical protein